MSQHLRKPKNTGTKRKDGSGITFVCVKKMYIYNKSEVSLDEFRLRRFFRDFSSDLHRTK